MQPVCAARRPNMRKTLMLLLLTLSCGAVTAQEEADDFYLYKLEGQEASAQRRIETDTMLFYRAMQSGGDLFGRITEYSFFHVDYARRGIYYADRPALIDGIEMRRANISVIRRLGVSEYGYAGLAGGAVMGGMAGADEFSTADGVPLGGGNVGAFFSGRGYLGGGRAALSALMRRGWSMSFYVAGRGGDDLYVDGVYTSAVDAGLRLTKETESGGSFAIVAAATVSERGLRSGSTDEAFTLTGDRLYNPSWGRQQGRERSGRVRREAVPFVMASYSSSPWRNTRIRVSAGGDWGQRRYGALGWYDAATPMPDNYRNLPSYFSSAEAAEAVAEAWRRGDERYTQIDWADLYSQNRMSPRGAVYAVDDRVERIARGEVAVLLEHDAGRGLTVSCGLRGRYDNTRRYKRMRDLLGAAYLEDIDYFLTDDDTYSNMLQNDLRNPSRRVAEGDRFAYDYALTERLAALQARLEYRSDRWYAECGLEAAGAQIFRRGYYEKELFAGSGSYGRSAVKTFTPYTAKVAAGYSVSARHYLSLGLMAAAVMPDADDMFLNAQYNNRMVDDPVLEKRYAAEAGYRFRSASADVSLTLFAAQTLDSRRTIRAYDDLSYLYCDVDVAGINIVRYGVEAAAEVRFTERLHGAFGLSAGRYRYGSNPLVSHYSDRDNAEVSMRSESYMNGCSVGGAPQLCATAELTYLDYRGWAFSCGAHAAAARYVDPSYVRRTERVARQASVSEEIYAEFMSQQRLNDAVTVDASASRWFYTRRGRIVVTLSVRNLLGTRDTVYGGYESSRIRRYTAGAQTVYRPLANIITYSYPRTYYCVVSWKF